MGLIQLRQKDINKLLGRSFIHDTYSLIANKLASVAASVKSLFQVPQLAVAPIAA